jgi:hypothetical protein
MIEGSMSMGIRKIRIFYIVLGLIVIGIVSEYVLTKPSFKLDDNAKAKLLKATGQIKLKFASKRIWNYRIAKGELSLQAMEKYRPGLIDEKRTYIRFAKEVPERLPTIKGFRYYGPHSLSPDESQMFLALSSEKEEYDPKHFAIIEMKNREVLFQGEAGSNIEDIAWSPDSSMFVVLEASSRRSLSISGILRMLIGHPSDVSTFYLSLYDPKGVLVVRTRVASRLVDGIGQVSWEK